MTPQQLQMLIQAIQALGLGGHMGGGMRAPQGPASRPAPAHATALVSTAPVLAPRQPLHTMTRTMSHGARATMAEGPARALPRLETVPSSAGSAYMSMARKVPAPGIGSHDINWSSMTKGKGAGNFGMA